MKRRTRGSAVVETAAFTFVGAALIAGTLFVGRLAAATRRAQALARHGAALSAAGVPAADVQAEVGDYAARLGAASWNLTLRRYDGSPAANFYRLAEASVDIAVPRPPALGGGVLTARGQAAVEEDRP